MSLGRRNPAPRSQKTALAKPEKNAKVDLSQGKALAKDVFLQDILSGTSRNCREMRQNDTIPGAEKPVS
jgi:hypothetical protein